MHLAVQQYTNEVTLNYNQISGNSQKKREKAKR